MRLLALSQYAYPEATRPEDIDDAVSLATLYEYDAIVIHEPLDSAPLPALRRMRAASSIPILLAFEHEVDPVTRTKAWDEGADAVLHNDPTQGEINSALLALIRRAGGSATNVVSVGNVSMDLLSGSISVCGQPVSFPKSEAKLLAVLLQKSPLLVTKEQLMDAMYFDTSEAPEPKIIDVFVCKIRNKLKAFGAGQVIETIFGRGYRACENAGETMLRRGTREMLFESMLEGEKTLRDLIALAPKVSVSAIQRTLTESKKFLTIVESDGVRTYMLNAAGREYVEKMKEIVE